jgi:exodeoxyribonuclease-3
VTLTIATWNVNGMRAAIRKGLGDQLQRIAPDVLMLQETRAFPEQLPAEWSCPAGWHVAWNPAERAGYAGTAIWSRRPFERGSLPTPDERDHEGRVVIADLFRPGDAKRGAGASPLLRTVCVYLPSGSSGPHRQAEKDRWLEHFAGAVRAMAASRVPTILGGDFNIAHTERDIFHWRSNLESSGFLPHERAWMGGLIGSGWHDLIREKYGDVDGPYSWWSNRGNARASDRGWRIDYLLANAAARPLIEDCWIDREAGLAISDHAPVIATLRL